MIFLWAWIFQIAMGSGDQVTLSRAAYEQLIEASANPEVDQEISMPQVRRREVLVTVSDAGIQLLVTWTIYPSQSRVFTTEMSVKGIDVEQMLWNGSPISGGGVRRGGTVWRIDAPLMKPSTLVMSGFIPKNHASFKQALGPGVRIALMGAASQTVRVTDTPDWHLRRGRSANEVLIDGTLWCTKPTFLLRLSKEPPNDTDVIHKGVAQIGIGMTVFDDRVAGRARIDWVRGSTQSTTLRLAMSGPMSMLDIHGVHVLSWTRRRDLVFIELASNAPKRIAITLSWRHTLKKRDLERLKMPQLRVLDVAEQKTSVQFASAGEVDIVPSLRNASAISAEAVPRYGRDLIDAAPVSAFHHSGVLDGDIHLLRYTPVDAPPMIIDVAETTLALTREGRALGRTRLTVRNDTATHVQVCLAPGVHLLGATVSQEPAALSKKDGCAQIQLPRSVASLDGGLSFPIDLIFRGESDAWARKEHRAIHWGTIRNAPIAVHRTTLILPPHYGLNRTQPTRHRVDAFTEGEGLTYGYGLDGVEEQHADTLFQNAVSDWMRNDFDSAQRQLGALAELGAVNRNITQLQSNIDAVVRKKSPKGGARHSAMTRRLREQAKVRSGSRKIRQMDAMKEADEALSSGDYARAETLYVEAQQITETLEVLENEESVEESSNAAKISFGLKQVQKGKAASGLGGAVESNAGSSSPVHLGGHMPSIQKKEKSNATDTDALAVSSTRLDLIIPEWGQSIHYQQLLLSPGELPEVIISAKMSRRK